MLCVTVEESVSTESTATRVTARNDSLEKCGKNAKRSTGVFW